MWTNRRVVLDREISVLLAGPAAAGSTGRQVAADVRSGTSLVITGEGSRAPSPLHWGRRASVRWHGGCGLPTLCTSQRPLASWWCLRPGTGRTGSGCHSAVVPLGWSCCCSWIRCSGCHGGRTCWARARVHLGEKGSGWWLKDGTADHIQLTCWVMKDVWVAF